MGDITTKRTQIYTCKNCLFECSEKSKYNRHLSTAKHKIRNKLETKIAPSENNIVQCFECIQCNYVTKKLSDYNRHLITKRHLKKANLENTAQTRDNSHQHKYICKCGKSYSHPSPLWYHKKRCHLHNEVSENSESLDTPPLPENRVVQEGMNESIVIKCFQTMMEAQAAEAQAMQAAQAEQTRLLIEAISLNGMQCITNNTTNNTNNNQFNLNVFLNEDCKDAYTLKEVAESIECTVSDLDRMDKDGYAATITRKILESIENMSITERPIHCTDARRNAVCVKSETGWERNEEALKTLNSTIFLIGNKIHGVMDDWRAKYPEHFKGSESRRKQYHRLVLEVIKVSDPVTELHIVKKVCSGVVLDRKAAMAR